MRQFSTLYIPGSDHAGIATQAVVEKQLARNPKNGKSKRQDFSRPEFVQGDKQDDTETWRLCGLVARSLHNESAVIKSSN